jgi:hypothetical protein
MGSKRRGMGSTELQVKVVFPFDLGAETMWADRLEGGKYRLDNIPSFAYGVSLGDIFEAKAVEGDPRPYFDRVLSRSGNRTFRITLAENLPESAVTSVEEAQAALKGVSDGQDRHGPEYFVYNVPPGPETSKIESLLDAGEDEGLWSWELSTPIDELNQK